MLEQLQNDLKTAMKAKDTVRLSTLRMAIAEIKKQAIELKGQGKEIDDAGTLSVLEKMIKQRRDSIEMYKKGGRTDAAAKEQAEIEIIIDYLPTKLSADDTEEAITKAITQTGAESKKDMGRVMAWLKSEYAGQLDMGIVSKMVGAKL